MSPAIGSPGPDPEPVLLAADAVAGTGVVRHLTLNRPARRNALNTELLQALILALSTIESDPRVHALVLTGNGPAFCAGGDTKEFREVDDPRASMAGRAALLTDMLGRLANLPVPTVAVGAGPALGAGGALLLACDVVIGARGLQLGFPEIRDSVIPAVVMGAVRRRISPRVGLELFLTGRPIGVEEALRLGLVNSMAGTEEQAQAVVTELSDTWSAIDPVVLRRTKELHRQMGELHLDDALELGRSVTAATWTPSWR